MFAIVATKAMLEIDFRLDMTGNEGNMRCIGIFSNATFRLFLTSLLNILVNEMYSMFSANYKLVENPYFVAKGPFPLR